ncbi:hypothetical protein XELAEV_18015718mg [Xenopus laevis]|uniref:Uncharacterized protein n=1 Tax=Xenopus laevis TaxID=8355 RepID=A0A974HW89_XENLA|nr:hypothetical protein XELAEV_18015718mg [Xenopus laevis]
MLSVCTDRERHYTTDYGSYTSFHFVSAITKPLGSEGDISKTDRKMCQDKISELNPAGMTVILGTSSNLNSYGRNQDRCFGVS